MENITLAEVMPGDTVPASTVSTGTIPMSTVLTSTVLNSSVVEVHAPQAALRPLAGFGAGAFACDGAQVGSSASQLAAGPKYPRIRGAFAAVRPVPAWARAADAFGGAFQASANGGSTIGASNLGTGMASTRNGSAKQLNQTTRIYPVAPGGLGPHPAREPDPV
jgi:hypothetical protein